MDASLQWLGAGVLLSCALRSGVGSALQHLRPRCPPGEAGRGTLSAPPLSHLHSSSQLRAQPRAQPTPYGSMLLAGGRARADRRPPDLNSRPPKRQGGAVESPPPPQKSARCSHAQFMSSTVSRFPQAPHSNVTVPAPVGAVLRHACATPPAVHTVPSHPPFLFLNHEGATRDLVPLPRRSGRRSRFRLIDYERVSSRPIQLKAQRVGAHAQCHHGC